MSNFYKSTLVFIAGLSVMFLLFRCASKPFIKNTLAYEKISDNCDSLNPKFSMNSNLNGERYEFQRCLEKNFNGKAYSIERKGDTVLVRFRKINTKTGGSLFKITLDIDTYPRYNFLTIDDNTFPIIPVGN